MKNARKFAIFILVVVLILATAAPAVAGSWTLLRTTVGGFGSDPNPLALNKRVVKVVTIENIDTRTAYNVGLKFRYPGPNFPQTEDNIQFLQIIMSKEGKTICRFSGKSLKTLRINQFLTCNDMGDLLPGEKMQLHMYMRSPLPGKYTLVWANLFDGFTSGGGMGAFFE